MHVSPTVIQWQELARTTGNGVEATLLWNESRNLLRVAVSDRRLCDHLDFDTVDGHLLDAFRRVNVATQTPNGRPGEGAYA
jgi:hypothetical protein